MAEDTSHQTEGEEKVTGQEKLRKRFRQKRKIIWAAGMILLSMAALAACLILLLRFPWFSQQAAQLAVYAFNRRFPATLSIQRTTLHPSEDFLKLQGVALVPAKGENKEAPIEVAEVAIRYNPRVLLQKRIAINEIHFFQPRIHLIIDHQDGQLNLKDLITTIQRELFRGDSKIEVTIGNIGLSQGTLTFQDERKELSVKIKEFDFQGDLKIKNKSLSGILQVQDIRIHSKNWLPQIDSLKADLSIKEKGLVFQFLELQGEGLHMKIKGELTNLTRQPRLEASFSFQISSEVLKNLLYLGEFNVEGPLQAKGRIWGPLTDPSADVSIAGPSN